MTDLDAFAIGQPGPATPTGAGPRRHRHDWVRSFDIAHCMACGKTVPTIEYDVAQRRGRSARNRGNAAERGIAKRWGGVRRGQYGGAEDVTVSDLFVIQSKHSPGAFSERYARWLAALPRSEGRVPVLVVGDGSPGRHVRRLVVLEERDWLALHGPTGGDTDAGQ